MTKQMRAGKAAICTALGCSRDDVSAYQPTRTRGVYSDGDRYFTARAVGSTKPLPPGWTWVPLKGADWVARMHGASVFVASEANDE